MTRVLELKLILILPKRLCPKRRYLVLIEPHFILCSRIRALRPKRAKEGRSLLKILNQMRKYILPCLILWKNSFPKILLNLSLNPKRLPSPMMKKTMSQIILPMTKGQHLPRRLKFPSLKLKSLQNLLKNHRLLKRNSSTNVCI